MGINNQYNYYDATSEHAGMNFRRFPKASGIYKITNTINRKIYIGYATNIRLRCKTHRVELRSGKHKNPHLQLAWNLYGEISFDFEIIELCCLENLVVREDYWCKVFNSHNRNIGYNVQITGLDKRVCTEETKQRIGEANKGKVYLGAKNSSAKKVINTITGRIYGAVTELAQEENIPINSLRFKLRGRTKNDTPYKYL